MVSINNSFLKVSADLQQRNRARVRYRSKNYFFMGSGKPYFHITGKDCNAKT